MAAKRSAGMVASVLAVYDNLGQDWFVKVTYPEPSVQLTYIQGSGQASGDLGDPYTVYDRFGRTEEMRWETVAAATVLDGLRSGLLADILVRPEPLRRQKPSGRSGLH